VAVLPGEGMMLSEEPVTKYGEWPEPPYESPIEATFASCCFKHLRPDVHIEAQAETSTKHGCFRIDFVLSLGDKRIAVECDGRDFHEPFRDEFRDAILLGEGHLETIYHFRGCDLVYYPDDCIWLMSALEPQLFSERGRHILGRLQRVENENREGTIGVWNADVNRLFMKGSFESFSCRIWNGNQPYLFWAFRRNISMKSERNPRWPLWKALYASACEHPGASLDELLEMSWWT